MNRLQISLTSEQYDFLKSESFVSGQSMAAVLRQLLDEVIVTRQQNMLKKRSHLGSHRHWSEN